jgi:ADP-ribosylglycohydrolase
MLVEMAIADAYGAGMEYTQPEFVRKNNRLTGYIQHPKWKNMKPGAYTDDTQMAVALAELMVSSGRNPNNWSIFDWAKSVMDVFCRDPREGYSGGFYNLLTIMAKEPDPEKRAFALLRGLRPHSRKNGGAMRAGVLGLLPDTQQVIDRAMFQASLTHASQEGLLAAAVSALLVHYFHYDRGSVEDLPLYLDEHAPPVDIEDSWADEWTGRVKSPGTQAVRAAVTAITQSTNLAQLLQRCVGFGGDVDTVAAIAVCAASRCESYGKALPSGLVSGLENRKYGLDFLRELDRKLMAKFPADAPDPEAEPEPQEPGLGDLVDSLFD